MIRHSRYYGPDDIENYKDWEEEITIGNSLRKKYGVIQMHMSMSHIEDKINIPCPKCGSKMVIEFGDYGKPLAQKSVECSKGEIDEGHGWWASVINLILN